MFAVLWLRSLRFRLFYSLFLRKSRALQSFGHDCAWNIDSRTLDEQSTVLCAGAGNDISFELDLIERLKCPVVLLDPSPTGLRTFEKHGEGVQGLTFLPAALGTADETIRLAFPVESEEGSFRPGASASSPGMDVPSRSIPSLAKELGWQRIDLLKIDIEGAEYAVLEQIVRDRLPVQQICVEYHHGGTFNYSRMDTVRSIVALWRAGYRLVHHVHWDHTFVKTSRTPEARSNGPERRS